MIEWIHEHKTVFWALASWSVFIFLATVAVVPFVVVKIPSDYFVRKKREKRILPFSNPVLQGMLVLIKNAFGAVLVVAGLIMLLTPGQGLFTIFVGMLLMNFPGKYRLEKWFIGKRSVRRSINWLRYRMGRSPLLFEKSGKM